MFGCAAPVGEVLNNTLCWGCKQKPAYYKPKEIYTVVQQGFMEQKTNNTMEAQRVYVLWSFRLINTRH